MLTEFETRLADVLGSRLPAPFGGRVRRRGVAPPAGAGPVVHLGIEAIEPMVADFGSIRPEVVPGSDDQRRVVRLGVTIGIDIEAETAGDRLQELLGIDAVTYEMDHPDMRSAALLMAPGDQGFVLELLHLDASDLDIDVDLQVTAQGWFWPVGLEGQAGRAIERTLIREFRLPVQLDISGALEAGGADVDLSIRLGTTGTMVIATDTVESAPFGVLGLRLLDNGGGPGAGTLTGGLAGPAGSHLVVVTDGAAGVTYGPPAGAATDHLVVVAFTRDDDGNDHEGIEIARFVLDVAP